MDFTAHLRNLAEKRMNVANALFAHLEANPDPNEEAKATEARISSELDQLDHEIREYSARLERDKEAAALREMTFSAFGEHAAVRADLTAEQAFRNWALSKNAGPLAIDIRTAARERELLRQGASADEIRALAWDTGSSASLVPTTLARTLYEYMEASNGILRAPTTKLFTNSGEPLDIPRVATHGIATQVSGQGTAIGGTDPVFAKTTLNAYKYGQLAYVANEVLADGGIDIASFLGRNMGRAVGRLLATELTVGTGTNEPNGIMTAITGSGTIATGGSLITPTVEKLIDLQYSVNDMYRSSGSAGWLMNDSTAGTLRKLRDGAGGTIGAFLWEPSLTAGVINGTPDRLLGHPVYTETNVQAAGSANKTVAFGDMSAYYVRIVGSPVVERDDSVKFAEDQAAFRVKLRADGDLVDTTAMNAIRQVVA